MTATTPTFAIPYPEITDFVKDGATAMENMAERIDDSLLGMRGLRSFIINGDFRVNQRNLTSTTSNNAYGHDRWRFSYNGVGTSTYSNVSFSLGNAITGYEPQTFAQMATTGQSGTNVFTHLVQRIESVRSLAGQQATVSFWAKATSGTPKIGVSIVQNFGTGGSPSSAVETHVTAVTLSTTWARYTATINVPSISGKTLGSGGNDYLELRFWFSAGTDYNAQSGSIGIQTNTFGLWGVQIEKGAVATPFELRPIALEQLLCFRYFQNLPYGKYNEVVLTLGYSPSNYYYGATDFMFPMRGSPTYASPPSINARRGSDAALLSASTVYWAATGSGSYYAIAVATGGYNAAAFFFGVSTMDSEL